jgi:cyclic pyranopterin phosphate synthase
MNGAEDRLGRPLRDLRISVTDRCNLRCPYCMPAEVFGPAHAFLPRAEILTFEEITRAVRVMTRLGVRKVRLTGGEPLLRRELPLLVAMLAACEGVQDLALTTNGILLGDFAGPLRRAGLQRVTVSLDALDDEVFRATSGSVRGVGEVLAGIEAAAALGLTVKINCVVQRGVNEDQILPLVHYGRQTGITVRFIEYMDVGNHNGWTASEVVSSRELRKLIGARFPLEPLAPDVPGQTSVDYRYADGKGVVGFISSVTEPFCAGCQRARLAADGKLFTCLFASSGFDLRDPLRKSVSDQELEMMIAGLWIARADRYSEQRAEFRLLSRRKVEMSYVGG